MAPSSLPPHGAGRGKVCLGGGGGGVTPFSDNSGWLNTVSVIIFRHVMNFDSWTGTLKAPILSASEKVASDLGLVGGFRRVLRFPLPVITG